MSERITNQGDNDQPSPLSSLLYFIAFLSWEISTTDSPACQLEAEGNTRMWIPYLQLFDISFREFSFLQFTPQVWCGLWSTLNLQRQCSVAGMRHNMTGGRKRNANVNLLGKNKDES